MNAPLVHLTFALAFCVTAITGFGFWYAAVEAKSTEVAKLELRIREKTETAGRIASARASLFEISGDEAMMRSYFVSETGVVAFITDLETKGQDEGASLSVVSVATKGTGAEQTLVFSLSVRGTFDSVMRTVGAIEYAPYDLYVSSFSLEHDENDLWHADVGLIVGSVSASATSTKP